MTFRKCKYGCGLMIETRNTDEGWRPFLESGEMHNCPESPYNKQKANESNAQNTLTAKREITMEEPTQKTYASYNMHRVRIVAAGTIETLQDRTNGILAENDSKGYIHRGTTFVAAGSGFINEIHYEIPAGQPEE
jgi:hypothetical protein